MKAKMNVKSRINGEFHELVSKREIYPTLTLCTYFHWAVLLLLLLLANVILLGEFVATVTARNSISRKGIRGRQKEDGVVFRKIS